MRELLLFLEAYIRLVTHDFFMLRHDFAALHRNIKNYPVHPARGKAISIEPLCHSLDVASALYPKPPLCLQRSSVLVKLLRKRGIPAQMIIGAQKLPFKAHAWVEVDGKIINDRLASRERFLVMEVC
jgi:hypothetical protein